MFRPFRAVSVFPFIAITSNRCLRFCATGSGGDRENKGKDNRKKEVEPPKTSGPPAVELNSGRRYPKGFEAFYSKYILGKMPFTRLPEESVRRAYIMSLEERVLTLNLVAKALKWKRIRRIGIFSFLFGCVVMARLYIAKSYRYGKIDDYVAVAVDLSGHTATYINQKGNYMGVRNFIDYRAFEASCDKDADVLVLFHSYYPWVPMLLLCLLPVLAATNHNFSRAAKLNAVITEKSRFNFKHEVSVSTRLKDVAGITEAKHEVVEVIDFLKKPALYQALGAKLPKGVLLDGPPGVGKTLLAKAVAGEAMVPFLSCSGSEFEEVYVGVGAQRVRELFRQAHECKPCVVFIDEIDAFGGNRMSAGGGSSRSTLNAFLSELDGFKDSTGIMVLAATNRADILDSALTRSGRFDRKITLEKPSYKDRVAIARVHLKPLELEPSSTIDGYAEIVAALTPGCSGADIFNICNEAAIQAAREGKDNVSQRHFHQSVERVLIGLERSAVHLSEIERERIAFHEAGLVILHWFQEKTDPVVKTTILPRGGHRTGVTQKLPQTVFISTQEQLMQNLVAQLGGYVAEEYFFKDVSTNASNDVRSATNKARYFICSYGMDPETIGHFGYKLDEDRSIQKPFGPLKEDMVDQAVHRLLKEALDKARLILYQYIDKTRALAALLMRRETLTAHDIWLLLGDRPVMTKEFRAYLES